MTREQLKDAVVEAARVTAREIGATGKLLDALAALDAHPAQEVVTLALWQYQDGDTEFCKVGSVTDERAGKWTRLGTVSLPLTREGGR